MGVHKSKFLHPTSSAPTDIIEIDEAVHRIGIGKFQHRVLFAAGTCFMADSVQVMLLSILTRKLQNQWEFADSISSMIQSCLFAGSMVGTLILGPLADRIGRKPVLIVSASIISIFGLCTSLITGYQMLFPIVFSIGFGIGGLTVPFDILAEFLTTETRGYYLLFIKYFWTCGSMLVPVVAYFTLEVYYSWRLFAGLCIIPCLFSLVCGTLYVPESPRWLVSRGRKEEALAILRKAAETNGIDPYVVFPIGIELADQAAEHGEFSDLFSPRWKDIVLKLAALWTMYCFCFYGAIMTVTRIFDDTDNPNSLDFDYVAIFVSSAAELLGTASTIFLIDRIGRVKTLVGAFFSAGISLFCLCLLTDIGVAPRSVLITFALIGRAAEMATACVVWIVTVELLSTEILSTGHSAVNAIARAGAFFSPYLVVESNPLWVVGLVLLVVNMVSAVTASTLIETKGVELGKAVLIEPAKKYRGSEVSRACITIPTNG